MITVNVNETFPIVAILYNEITGGAASGETVSYEVRKQPGDVIPSPGISGTLTESSVTPGTYTKNISIPTAGTYLVYVTCTGFLSNVEEVVVSSENLYEVLKQNRHYNISVEDVPRSNSIPTASQITRKVPLGRTDYVVTKIKQDNDSDWSGDIEEGRVYAWYLDETSRAPYKMGGSS
jgi:hypothetical protein